ncbi:hypothetical protein FNF28_02125 [Cafeteria roenbergensis]|uniref:thermospermine synthase n=1 Tax=Cafeteria roenbergensis TaxID=33653 RepID=A0A5A8DXE6_CAFRO|nr:hypothetical protein FNF28_02125 [Cafeteria roenbergensis]
MAAASAAAPDSEVVMTSGFWFREEVTEDMSVTMRLKNITFDAKSEFQRAQIVETAPFGKTLVLDGKSQSAKFDEPVYHESLVHPALLMHPNPKSVYIGGGGEGATAREILRHKTVEKCVMVDIDEVVCNICKEQMPEWGAGAWDDARFEVHFEDAKAYLEKDERKYDVIIMDIADPIEAGPGIVLYTQEFYKFAVTKLNPGGILVTQSGPGSVLNADECFACINQTLRTVFDFVVPYTSDVPSFGSNWAFNMAFNKDSDIGAKLEAAAGASPSAKMLSAMTPAVFDDAIAARGLTGDLKFLDGISAAGIFGVPRPVRDTIEAETRVMTVANPPSSHRRVQTRASTLLDAMRAFQSAAPAASSMAPNGGNYPCLCVFRGVEAERSAFALAPPSLGLFHNACGQDGVASSHKPIKPLRSAFDAEAGVWRVWIRPKATTGSHLAQVRVQWGANVVMSGGFEVRTKPHKWVLLQRVPSHWDVAAVEAFVARCDPSSTSPIITLVRPSAPPAGAPADAGMPHAFVQLRDRSAAHDMMKGFRALCASSASSSSSSSSSGAAAGGACDGVVASFLAGLSRAVAEDPSLASLPVPVPSLACPAFVQVPADDTASTVSVRSVSGGASSPPERASKRGRDCDDPDGDEQPEQEQEPELASCGASSVGGSHCSASSRPASKRARPASPLGLSSASQVDWDSASVGSSSRSSALASTHGTGRCTSAAEDAMSFQSLPAPVLPLSAPRWRVGGAYLAAPSLIQRSVSLATCDEDCDEGVLERPPTDDCAVSFGCHDGALPCCGGHDDASLLGLLA